MYLYLTVAHTIIFVPYIMGLAIFVGVISGLLGISGGFILTPLMITLGIPPAIAVGSASAQVFAASLSAVTVYHKKRLIPYRFALTLITGGIIGVICGIMLFRYLSIYYNLELMIQYGFIILLLLVSGLLFLPPPQSNKILTPDTATKTHFFKFVITGFIIGVLSGILGIGGGFLIIPALTYYICVNGKDAIIISQTNVMCVSLISFIMHAVINHNIDPVLSIILVIGGIIGSHIGLWFGCKISPRTSRYIFMSIITSTAFILIYGLI